tara:strand:+ start:71 stop:400 length:330 start_codon:yes stop_codon:yes gene_type:complete
MLEHCINLPEYQVPLTEMEQQQAEKITKRVARTRGTQIRFYDFAPSLQSYYEVDEDNNTICMLFRKMHHKQRMWLGLAKFNPRDQFDPLTGMQISFSRAFRLYLKDTAK